MHGHKTVLETQRRVGTYQKRIVFETHSHLKTIHNVNTDDWLSKAKLLNLIIL